MRSDLERDPTVECKFCKRKVQLLLQSLLHVLNLGLLGG